MVEVIRKNSLLLRIFICSLLIAMITVGSAFAATTSFPSPVSGMSADCRAKTVDNNNNTYCDIGNTSTAYISYNLPRDAKTLYVVTRTASPPTNAAANIIFSDAGGKILSNQNLTAGSLYTAKFSIPANSTQVKISGIYHSSYTNLWIVEVYVDVEDTTPPAVPSGLTATPSYDGNAIDLKWNAVPDLDLDSYLIYLDGVLLTKVKGTSYTIPSLTAGKTYSIALSAIDVNKNESAKSPSVQATPFPPPEKPSLSYSSTINSITLNWDNVGLSYDVWKMESGVAKYVDTTAGTSYTANNLTPLTDYQFYVNATDKYGRKVPSALLTATTKDLPPQLKPTLELVSITDSEASLRWDDVGGTYDIYVNNRYVNTVNTTSYIVRDLTPNLSYDFQLQSKDSYGRVAYSNIVTVQTKKKPPVKPDFTVSDITSSGFTIAWTLDPNALDYTVMLDNKEITALTDTAYTFKDLMPLTKYLVQLRANGDGAAALAVQYVTTLDISKPKINNASFSNDSGFPDDPTKKILTYEPNELVTRVKIFQDGHLLGQYPVSQKQIPVDLSSVSELFSDFKIVPVPDGEEYNLTAYTKTTGNLDFDDMLASFLSMFHIAKSAFYILAVLAAPLTVLVALFFWNRRKSKQLVRGSGSSGTQAAAAKAPRRPYKPWHRMTDQEKMEYRSDKHYEKTGYRIANIKKGRQTYGLFGLGGEKQFDILTYEKNGVLYKEQYVRGRGRVYVPKDAKNQLLHVKHQVQHVGNQFKAAFSPQQPKPKQEIKQKVNGTNKVLLPHQLARQHANNSLRNHEKGLKNKPPFSGSNKNKFKT